jgi:hypothetical protein
VRREAQLLSEGPASVGKEAQPCWKGGLASKKGPASVRRLGLSLTPEFPKQRKASVDPEKTGIVGL